jgi:integrase
MATVDLKICKVRSKGHTYYYAWRGGPRIKADPTDVEAFAREVAEHRGRRKAGDGTKIKGLGAMWKSSDAWTTPPEKGGLAESTKKSWRPWLVRIEERFGELSTKQFDRPEIRKDIKAWLDTWKDKPRTADYGKQVLSAMLTFAVDEGLIMNNPCKGMANRYQSDRSEIIWTDADVDRLEKLVDDPKAAVSKEIVWALKLACLTGLRQADLLKLAWSHVDEFSVEIKAGKSRKRGKGQRSVTIPRYPELDALLKEIPQRSTQVLTNISGHAWRSGFSSSWNKAMKAMKETRLHFHDARGTFATKIYSADFGPKEIAALLGWSEEEVEKIINRYVNREAIMQEKIRQITEGLRKRDASPAGNEPGT